MADLSKLKRKGSLGAPPSMEEASTNLDAPETAPIAHEAPVAPARSVEAPALSGEGALRRDGRKARRTGRTLQFATRVSEEFNDRLRLLAERENLLLVEVLERALDAYESRSGNRSA